MAKRKPAADSRLVEEWTTKLVQADGAALLRVALQNGAVSRDLFTRIVAMVKDDRPTYKPIEGQKAFHDSLARTRIIAGGIRAGKSRSVGHQIAYDTATTQNAVVWIVAISYALARPEFEDCLKDLRALKCIQIKDLSTPNEGPWSFKTDTGAYISTRSAEDVGKLEAIALTHAALCESAQLSQGIYDALAGRVFQARTQGKGHLYISGRFQGADNWYVEAWRKGQLYGQPGGGDIFSMSMRTWDNVALVKPCDGPPPEGRCPYTNDWYGAGHFTGFHNREIQALLEEHSLHYFKEAVAAEIVPDADLVLGQEFDERVHCVPMSFEERDNRDERALPILDGNRVTGFKLPVYHPVLLAVDPGWSQQSGFAVLATQIHDEKVFVIDEVFVQGLTTESVISLIKGKPWFPYVRGGWSDRAAAQHHAQASVLDTFRGHGIYLHYNERLPVETKVERLRGLLKPVTTPKHPRIYLNSLRSAYGGPTPRLLYEAANWKYQRQSDEKQQAREIPDTRPCDAWSALGYLVCGEMATYDAARMTKPITLYLGDKGAEPLAYAEGGVKTRWV